MSETTAVCTTCDQKVFLGKNGWYHSIETQSTWDQAHPVNMSSTHETGLTVMASVDVPITAQIVALAAVVGPDDVLVIALKYQQSAADLDEWQSRINDITPNLAGRVILVEGAENMAVVNPAPCGCQNRDRSAPECVDD